MAWIGTEDPFFDGVQAGVARAWRHDLRAWEPRELPLEAEGFREFLEVPDVREVLEQPLGFARDLLGSRQASGRFTELFAEMLTVAVIARHAYDDEALTQADIDSYLQQSFSIFNSFRHP